MAMKYSSRSCTVYQQWTWTNGSWVANGSPYHNAPSSVPYDDGTYAGTLYLNSVSGSPNPFSSPGAFEGEGGTTSTTGTAYYSGDVPLKQTEPPPDNGGTGASITAKNINKTSARAVIENLYYPAKDYGNFEVELWNGAETEYYYTRNWIDSSSLNYTSYDFSGLSQGKSYMFKAWVRTPGGNRTFIGRHVFTTLTDPLPGGVGTISVIEGQTTLDIAWSHATDATKYAIEVRLNNSSGSLIHQSYPLTTSANLSGLSSSTTYYIKVYAMNDIGNGPASEKTATTKAAPQVPASLTNLLATVSNATEVTLTWDAVSGATSYSAEIYLKGTSTIVDKSYSFQGTSIKFTGLAENTDFTAKVYGVNSAGNGTPDYEDFSTKTNRPADWNWTTLLSSGSLYLDSSDILRADVVGATEWNDFCKRINDFRKYKGLANATFTTAVSKASLTASIFNEARTAINSMTPPTSVPSSVITGNTGVYSKLVALKTSLNSIK